MRKFFKKSFQTLYFFKPTLKEGAAYQAAFSFGIIKKKIFGLSYEFLKNQKKKSYGGQTMLWCPNDRYLL